MVREFFKRTLGIEDTESDLPPPPAEKSIRVVHTKEVGTFGTRNYSGYPMEEYLDALQGTRRADLYDKMRRGDSQVKMCLAAVKSPIKAATWEVEPADTKEEWSQEDADKDAELIEWMLFDGMEKTWTEYLSEALTMLEFGHAIFEMIDGVTLNHPKFGSVNHIKCMAWRSPRTIERWDLDPNTGKLLKVAQYAYGDIGRVVDIPAEFLQVLTLEREGANYEGISALRGVYGNWYRKQEYLKINAIGIEKFAIPTPIAEIPENKSNTAEYQNLIEVLESYIGHEKQYITVPVGWKLDLKTNVYDPEKVEVSIDNEDKRMVKGFMANFLELGMGSGGGSYSLSFDLSDFFLGSIEHIAHMITSSFNRDIIPRMIELNRGPRQAYPKLKVSGISDKIGEELGRLLDLMVKNKIITPDDVLEKHMRKRIGLPEMSLDGQRQVQQPGALPQVDEEGNPIPPEQIEEPEIDPKTGKPKLDPKKAGKAPPVPPKEDEKKPGDETSVPKLAEKIRKLRMGN